MPRSSALNAGSIMVDANLRGLDKALMKLGRWRNKVDPILERVLDRHAIRLHRSIIINITNWPAVDTGFYRNSVTVEKEKLSRSVGPTAEYSEYVELGTHKMAARPSTLPAWVRQRPIWLREMKEAMKFENVLRGI